MTAVFEPGTKDGVPVRSFSHTPGRSPDRTTSVVAMMPAAQAGIGAAQLLPSYGTSEVDKGIPRIRLAELNQVELSQARLYNLPTRLLLLRI